MTHTLFPLSLPRRAVALALACAAIWGPAPARADAVDTLRTFVATVNSGKGAFTQTVTSPDGKKVRKSSGSIEFLRPNRFRFAYNPPLEQLIVGDGRQVWLFDADLNQVTVRPMDQALGASPAALLSSGGSIEKDFVLKALPTTATPSGAIEWVEAVPKAREGQFQWVRLGWKAGQLAVLEILDGFGQRSRLDFVGFEARAEVAADRFRFTPPPGADVLRQP